jgi:hypothetical protein
VFAGKAPLDLVVFGAQDGLLTVQRFLEAACQGQYMLPNELDIGFRPYTNSDIILS